MKLTGNITPTEHGLSQEAATFGTDRILSLRNILKSNNEMLAARFGDKPHALDLIAVELDTGKFAVTSQNSSDDHYFFDWPRFDSWDELLQWAALWAAANPDRVA